MDNEQLPKGYKNTEVGLIPEDWEVETLDDISELTSSKRIFESDYVSSGVPFYRGKEISLLNENKKLDEEYFISEEKYNGIKSVFGVPVKNDILITAVGTLGNIYLVPNNEKFYFKDGNLIWIRNIKKVLPEYLSIQLRRLRNEIINNAIGSSQKALTIVVLKKQFFPLPPTKAEQTAIATALSDADALINSLEKLIAKKRNIKQGAMQQLLKPKEGWEVKKLGDFLDYEQPTEYLVTDTEYNDNNQIPVLTAGKTFILGYTNEENGIFKNLPVIIFDDFTTAIKYVDFPFKAKSSAMKMLLPKNEKINLRFIYEIMLQIKYQVADHKRHWIGEYSKIEIKVPSTPEEQNEIATILSDMDAEIQALETKLEKYRKIKLGMMQNLLTGKIRLV